MEKTMATPTEALAKVGNALEVSGLECALHETKDDTSIVDAVNEALALLPIIESAMLPDLPDGYAIESIKAKIHSTGYRAVLCGRNNIDFGAGDTPRAAVLAAIEKVKP